MKTALLNKLYGRVQWDVFRPQDVARTTVWAATARSTDIINGACYVRPGFAGQPLGLLLDDGVGSELWAWTQRIVTGVPLDEGHVREWCHEFA